MRNIILNAIKIQLKNRLLENSTENSTAKFESLENARTNELLENSTEFVSSRSIENSSAN